MSWHTPITDSQQKQCLCLSLSLSLSPLHWLLLKTSIAFCGRPASTHPPSAKWNGEWRELGPRLMTALGRPTRIRTWRWMWWGLFILKHHSLSRARWVMQAWSRERCMYYNVRVDEHARTVQTLKGIQYYCCWKKKNTDILIMKHIRLLK